MMSDKHTNNTIVMADRAFVEATINRKLGNAKLADPKTPSEALTELISGNDKFRNCERPCFDVGPLEPELNAPPQRPIAVIVCCSDSRVPPELVFWQGLGRLFIVRVAGNTVDAAALGSIVYAVSELKSPLIVVLGHEHCGAVRAAVKFVECGEIYDRSLAGVVEPILPAVLKAKTNSGCAHDLYEESNRENVRRTVSALRNSSEPLLQHPRAHGKLWIFGARYDVNDGSVNFIDRDPLEAPAVS